MLYFLYLILGVPLIISWFVNISGSPFDLDSSDTLLYNEVAKDLALNGFDALSRYAQRGYGTSDIGALLLPALSYKLVNHWWLSRLFNILLISLSFWSDVKLRPEKIGFIIFFYANPVVLYYCSSGLKEVLLMVIILWLLRLNPRSRGLYVIGSSFLEFFRSGFGGLWLLNQVIKRRFIFLIFLFIPIIFISLPSNYKYFLKFIFSNPHFIISRTPFSSMFALITGPIPLYRSLLNPFNQLLGLGMLFYAAMVLTYFLKSEKSKFGLVIILILMLLVSGTLWKIRYWLPVYSVIFSSILVSKERINIVYFGIPLVLFMISFFYVWRNYNNALVNGLQVSVFFGSGRREKFEDSSLFFSGAGWKSNKSSGRKWIDKNRAQEVIKFVIPCHKF